MFASKRNLWENRGSVDNTDGDVGAEATKPVPSLSALLQQDTEKLNENLLKNREETKSPTPPPRRHYNRPASAKVTSSQPSPRHSESPPPPRGRYQASPQRSPHVSSPESAKASPQPQQQQPPLLRQWTRPSSASPSKFKFPPRASTIESVTSSLSHQQQRVSD